MISSSIARCRLVIVLVGLFFPGVVLSVTPAIGLVSSSGELMEATASVRLNAALAQRLNGFDNFSFPDGRPIDEFGGAVSVDGERALIGASSDSNGLSERGSVYAFEKRNGAWQFVQKLTSRDTGQTWSGFGASLQISGDTAVIGAFGATFVFDYVNGVWTETARLIPTGAVEPYALGPAVSIDGDTIAVGHTDLTCGIEGYWGHVRVYRRSADTWSQEACLSPQRPRDFERFGTSVAVSDDTLIVGAPDNALPGGSGMGSAYAFSRTGSEWSSSQQLPRSKPRKFDGFGTAVAIQGDSAAVGAPAIGDSGRGSAVVFHRDGDTWLERQHIVPTDPDSYNGFGAALALDSNRLVVGAPGAERLYVFESVEDHFVQQRELSQEGNDQGLGFGGNLSLQGDSLLAGVPRPPHPAFGTGRAFLFNLSAIPSIAAQRFDSMGGPTSESFGSSIAILGDLAVVGTQTGVAYVFRRGPVDWSREAVLQSNQSFDGFGLSVAIVDQQILVAAPWRNNQLGALAGSVFVYRQVAGLWNLTQELVAEGGSTLGYFGLRLSASDEWLAVGGEFDDVGSAMDSGSVRLFQYLGGEWQQRFRLFAPVATSNSRFGEALQLRDGTLAVAAPGEGLPPSILPGSVYIFQLQDQTWQLVSSLGPNTDAEAAFGSSVSLEDEGLLVGAPREAQSGRDNVGAVYVFRQSGASWSLDRVLRPADPTAFSRYGRAVEWEGALAAIAGYLDLGGVVDLRIDEEDWPIIDRLRSPNVTPAFAFAAQIAADGENLLVASPEEIGSSVFANRRDGAVYSVELNLEDPAIFADGFE